MKPFRTGISWNIRVKKKIQSKIRVSRISMIGIKYTSPCHLIQQLSEMHPGNEYITQQCSPCLLVVAICTTGAPSCNGSLPTAKGPCNQVLICAQIQGLNLTHIFNVCITYANIMNVTMHGKNLQM